MQKVKLNQELDKLQEVLNQLSTFIKSELVKKKPPRKRQK